MRFTKSLSLQRGCGDEISSRSCPAWMKCRSAYWRGIKCNRSLPFERDVASVSEFVPFQSDDPEFSHFGRGHLLCGSNGCDLDFPSRGVIMHLLAQLWRGGDAVIG